MVRKAYLTPPDIPEGLTCRTLKMPNSKEWLGVFNSALLTLTQSWQWEQVQSGDLTVEQAIEKVHEVLAEFWAVSECEGCYQPTGEPFIGYDEFGEFMQLYPDGWGEPSGDYTVPPIPPRESGTDIDKRCLAAANAANVLKVLYEQLSDDYAADLGTAEALSNLIALIVLVVGGWLGLAVAAVIAIYRIMFQVVYETIEFVTSDYWTTEFDDKLQCALYSCASVDGVGVVTFNMECVVKEIAQGTSILSDPFHVLLFGQVQAMLNIIGTDGLNAAGGTTAIGTANCDECDDHCFYLNLRTTNGSSLGLTSQGGTYVSGIGWRAVVLNSVNRPSYGFWNFGVNRYVYKIETLYSKGAGSGVNNTNSIRTLYPTATGYATTQLALDPFGSIGTNLVKTTAVNTTIRGVGYDINSGASASPLVEVHGFKIYYRGAIPSGWSDNCEE